MKRIDKYSDSLQIYGEKAWSEIENWLLKASEKLGESNYQKIICFEKILEIKYKALLSAFNDTENIFDKENNILKLDDSKSENKIDLLCLLHLDVAHEAENLVMMYTKAAFEIILNRETADLTYKFANYVTDTDHLNVKSRVEGVILTCVSLLRKAAAIIEPLSFTAYKQNSFFMDLSEIHEEESSISTEISSCKSGESEKNESLDGQLEGSSDECCDLEETAVTIAIGISSTNKEQNANEKWEKLLANRLAIEENRILLKIYNIEQEFLSSISWSKFIKQNFFMDDCGFIIENIPTNVEQGQKGNCFNGLTNKKFDFSNKTSEEDREQISTPHNDLKKLTEIFLSGKGTYDKMRTVRDMFETISLSSNNRYCANENTINMSVLASVLAENNKEMYNKYFIPVELPDDQGMSHSVMNEERKQILRVTPLAVNTSIAIMITSLRASFCNNIAVILYQINALSGVVRHVLALKVSSNDRESAPVDALPQKTPSNKDIQSNKRSTRRTASRSPVKRKKGFSKIRQKPPLTHSSEKYVSVQPDWLQVRCGRIAYQTLKCALVLAARVAQLLVQSRSALLYGWILLRRRGAARVSKCLNSEMVRIGQRNSRTAVEPPAQRTVFEQAVLGFVENRFPPLSNEALPIYHQLLVQSVVEVIVCDLSTVSPHLSDGHVENNSETATSAECYVCCPLLLTAKLQGEAAVASLDERIRKRPVFASSIHYKTAIIKGKNERISLLRREGLYSPSLLVPARMLEVLWGKILNGVIKIVQDGIRIYHPVLTAVSSADFLSLLHERDDGRRSFDIDEGNNKFIEEFLNAIATRSTTESAPPDVEKYAVCIPNIFVPTYNNFATVMLIRRAENDSPRESDLTAERIMLISTLLSILEATRVQNGPLASTVAKSLPSSPVASREISPSRTPEGELFERAFATGRITKCPQSRSEISSFLFSSFFVLAIVLESSDTDTSLLCYNAALVSAGVDLDNARDEVATAELMSQLLNEGSTTEGSQTAEVTPSINFAEVIFDLLNKNLVMLLTDQHLSSTDGNQLESKNLIPISGGNADCCRGMEVGIRAAVRLRNNYVRRLATQHRESVEKVEGCVQAALAARTTAACEPPPKERVTSSSKKKRPISGATAQMARVREARPPEEEVFVSELMKRISDALTLPHRSVYASVGIVNTNAVANAVNEICGIYRLAPQVSGSGQHATQRRQSLSTEGERVPLITRDSVKRVFSAPSKVLIPNENDDIGLTQTSTTSFSPVEFYLSIGGCIVSSTSPFLPLLVGPEKALSRAGSILNYELRSQLALTMANASAHRKPAQTVSKSARLRRPATGPASTGDMARAADEVVKLQLSDNFSLTSALRAMNIEAIRALSRSDSLPQKLQRHLERAFRGVLSVEELLGGELATEETSARPSTSVSGPQLADELLKFLEQRLDLLIKFEDALEVRYAAATKIQTLFRGWVARRAVVAALLDRRLSVLARMVREDAAAFKVTAVVRAAAQRKERAARASARRKLLLKAQTKAAIVFQKYIRRWLSVEQLRRLRRRHLWLVADVRTIQQAWRAALARRRVAAVKSIHEYWKSWKLSMERRCAAAVLIEALFRGYRDRLIVIRYYKFRSRAQGESEAEHRRLIENEERRMNWQKNLTWAAVTIQSLWRGFRCRSNTDNAQKIKLWRREHENAALARKRTEAQKKIAQFWRGCVVRNAQNLTYKRQKRLEQEEAVRMLSSRLCNLSFQGTSCEEESETTREEAKWRNLLGSENFDVLASSSEAPQFIRALVPQPPVTNVPEKRRDGSHFLSCRQGPQNLTSGIHYDSKDAAQSRRSRFAALALARHDLPLRSLQPVALPPAPPEEKPKILQTHKVKVRNDNNLRDDDPDIAAVMVGETVGSRELLKELMYNGSASLKPQHSRVSQRHFISEFKATRQFPVDSCATVAAVARGYTKGSTLWPSGSAQYQSRSHNTLPYLNYKSADEGLEKTDKKKNCQSGLSEEGHINALRAAVPLPEIEISTPMRENEKSAVSPLVRALVEHTRTVQTVQEKTFAAQIIQRNIRAHWETNSQGGEQTCANPETVS